MKAYKFSFLFVFIAHLLLLTTIVFTKSVDKKIGYQHVNLINAQIYYATPKKGLVALPQSNHQVTKKVDQKPLTTQKNGSLPTTALKNKTSNHSTAQQMNSITAGDNDELLMLLHNALTKAQVYPEEAVGQTGEVSLKFKLLPNGMIEHLLITKSSGISSLDEAAIQTVKKIIPFQSAKNFLKDPAYFEIPIDFQS